MKPFKVIFATDEDLGIGKNQGLPWHLKGDMRYFRDWTTGNGRNAVIMGRVSYFSMPPRFRPLPNRLNVVLSSNTNLALPHEVLHQTSFNQALETCSAMPEIEEIWIAGGSSVYEEAMAHPLCEAIHWTQVTGRFGCDTFVPDFRCGYEEVERSEPMEENGISYVYTIHHRSPGREMTNPVKESTVF
jgi:dihydrofolate reductase